MDHPKTDDENDVDDIDDDEFFGSQGDDANEFGDMEQREIHARHHRLKTVGFLDAFDESKEELLQEGFETGFLESFEGGKVVGRLLGRAATQSKILQRNDSTSQAANETVHEFFSKEFQANRDSSTTVDDLSRLVETTKACFETKGIDMANEGTTNK